METLSFYLEQNYVDVTKIICFVTKEGEISGYINEPRIADLYCKYLDRPVYMINRNWFVLF